MIRPHLTKKDVPEIADFKRNDYRGLIPYLSLKPSHSAGVEVPLFWIPPILFSLDLPQMMQNLRGAAHHIRFLAVVSWLGKEHRAVFKSYNPITLIDSFA